MPTVLKTPLALRDVVDIIEFIRRDNPSAATKILAAIDQTCEGLATFPMLGQARPEFDPDLRSLPVTKYRKYVVFYKPVPGGIEVIRVVHGARDLNNLFRGNV